MPTLKYDHTDNGFCKVVYSWKPEGASQKLYYGIMDDGYHGVPRFVIMSLSPDFEPQSEIKLKPGIKFQAPKCGTELGQQVTEFLTEKGLLDE